MRCKIDQETYESLQVAVQYLCESEGKHYEEEDQPEGHIFAHAMRISAWLDRVSEPKSFTQRLEEHKVERMQFM